MQKYFKIFWTRTRTLVCIRKRAHSQGKSAFDIQRNRVSVFLLGVECHWNWNSQCQLVERKMYRFPAVIFNEGDGYRRKKKKIPILYLANHILLPSFSTIGSSARLFSNCSIARLTKREPDYRSYNVIKLATKINIVNNFPPRGKRETPIPYS